MPAGDVELDPMAAEHVRSSSTKAPASSGSRPTAAQLMLKRYGDQAEAESTARAGEL